MKILVLNPILYTADNNTIPKVNSIKDCLMYVQSLAFKSLGHDITLIASEDYKPQIKEDYEFDVVFQKTKFKKIFLPTIFPYQPELISYLKKNGKTFDLIISSEVFSLWSLFSVFFCREKTLVWQELNVHNNKFHKIPSYLWYNIIGKIFFRNTLIVPRSESASHFIKIFCGNVSEISVDHGININKFNPSTEKEKQFIVIGQLIKRKRVDYIIEQFTKFIRKHPNSEYRLLIAGRGVEEDNLKQIVKSLSMEEHIIFLGFMKHEELNNYIAKSIASLIATNKDLNMVSIPESIASGTPILTNNIPVFASRINENMLGIVCDNWTENELEQMIEKCDLFSKNCIKQREDFSARKSAEKLIDIYKRNLINCNRKNENTTNQ